MPPKFLAALWLQRDQMLRLFEAHREAEAARDIDAILDTFVPDPFLETMALGLRSEGRDAVRRTYEEGYFAAFPDLEPDDAGEAFGENVMVVWGTLKGTSQGEWMGVPLGDRIDGTHEKANVVTVTGAPVGIA